MSAAQVVQVLRAVLDADHEIRTAGEQKIEDGMCQPGFGMHVMDVILARDSVDEGMRQMAAVLLKRYVQAHWIEEGNKIFKPPVVSDGDKAALRDRILEGLVDPCGQVRTAVSTAVAAIAEWDWPEQWPELVPALIGAVQTKSSADAVQGALRCLSIVAQDLDDMHLPHLLAALLPEMAAIAANRGVYGGDMCRRALQVAGHMLRALGHMSGREQRQARDDATPHVAVLLGAVVGLLQAPLDSSADGDGFATRMEALRVAVAVVPLFASKAPASEAMPHLMGACRDLFLRVCPIYEAELVKGDGEGDRDAASDGEEQGLEALACQIEELIMCFIGSARLSPALSPLAGELAYSTGLCLQMTAEQAECWSEDPYAWLAEDMDDFKSARGVGEMLVSELAAVLGEPGVVACVDAHRHLLGDAQRFAAAGDARMCWIRREAALSLLGAVSDTLEDLWDARKCKSLPAAQMLGEVLQRDLDAATLSASPLVAARALWLIARLSQRLPGEMLAQALNIASTALGSSSMALQYGAINALVALVPRAPVDVVTPLLGQVYPALGSMLKSAKDDGVEWVLTALDKVVRKVPDAAAACHSDISEVVLRIWWAGANDPFLAPTCQDLLGALAAIPACQTSLLSRILPSLRQLLIDPSQVEGAPPNIQEAALDLTGVIARQLGAEGAREVHRACFGPTAHLAATSDDSGVVNSAAQLLQTLLAKAGPEFASWEGTGAASAPDAMLKVLEGLLAPNGDQDGALAASHLLSQLLATLPDHVGPVMGGVLQVIVMRLKTATVPLMIAGLICVVARLVHLACDGLISALSSMQVDGASSGLEVVMRQWTMHQGDVSGSYNIKLTTTGLLRVLQSGHPGLSEITVPGKIIDSGRIRTRARARAEGAEQWTQVALPVKIMMVLADTLVEASEQRQRGGEESASEDWETDSGAEDDMQGGRAEDGDLDILKILDQAGEKDDWDDAQDTIFLHGREERDPIKDVDLVAEIGSAVKSIAAAHSGNMDSVLGHMTPRQIEALREVITRG